MNTGGTVVLGADASYGNLVITGNTTLQPNGFRLYVSKTLTLGNASSSGTISANGYPSYQNNGSNTGRKWWRHGQQQRVHGR